MKMGSTTGPLGRPLLRGGGEVRVDLVGSSQFATAAGDLHLRVIEDGRPTVNIKVPVGVARWGMKMAQVLSPEMKDANLDWESLTAMIQEGEGGQIVEVEDKVEHKTVEVWLE
jgi:hypothetical protein